MPTAVKLGERKHVLNSCEALALYPIYTEITDARGRGGFK